MPSSLRQTPTKKKSSTTHMIQVEEGEFLQSKYSYRYVETVVELKIATSYVLVIHRWKESKVQ